MNSACAATDSADAQLEEITVTAQKRSESLQSVPLSISAFSAAQLNDRMVQSFIDYGTTVPNLGFASTGIGSATARTISIRGISGDNVTGFYIDETPVPDSIDPRIVDVERIEVLRGPQGTLYGARSMGGTVRLITQQPHTDEVEGRFGVTGSYTDLASHGNYSMDGALNVPLLDNRLAVRAVGFYDSDAGWFQREFPTSPGSPNDTVVKDVAHTNSYGGAISLAYQPTDTLTITPRVMRQRSDYNGFPYADFTIPASGPFSFTPSNFVQQRQYDVPEGGHDEWTLYSIGLTWKTAYGSLVSSSSYFDRDTFETEDSTAFVQYVAQNFLGITGEVSPAPIYEQQGFKRYVQEVRFSSTLEGPFQYVAGAYYSYTDQSQYFPPSPVAGIDAQSGGALGTDNQYSSYNRSLTKEPALFGEGTYRLTQQLSFTAGARLYRVTSASDAGYQSGFAVGGPQFTIPGSTLIQTGVNPKVQAEYRITDDHMVYATAAKGFRPGGVSPGIPDSPTVGCQGNLAALGLTSAETRQFQSDHLWNYELGLKTAWLDDRLTVDTAGYFIRWSNIQQLVSLPCGFGFTANAGSAESKGFELEVHSRPWRTLDLSAGLGYEHAVITAAGATSPQQPGDRVNQVPDWTGNLSATYTHELAAGLKATANMTYAYVGESLSANNSPETPRIRPPYSLLDARFALQRRQHEIALFAKNLTNEHANLADNRSIAAELPGRPRIVTNQPRTIGLEFRTRF
jgi:iron complex outermembrane recepter protein